MFVGDSPYFIKVVRNMALELCIALAASIAVVVLHTVYGISLAVIPTTTITILGGALSIFIAFRNSAAYDRYWEGRKLWGALINHSRTLARQVLTLVTPPAPDAGGDDVKTVQRRIVYTHLAFVNALRAALRDQPVLDEVKPFLDEETLARLKNEQNVANALVSMEAEQVRALFTRGWLSDLRWTSLDATLTEFTNIQGGCERIKNTPLPRAYTYFTRYIVEAYCIVLPFGLVEHLGWRTPLLAMLVSFTFLVLERIGRLLEQPFGMRHNDLPLAAMCRTIENNLRQRLGETELPPALKPVDGVLL